VASKAATRTDSRLALKLASLASFGAAIIHFAVVPTHWQEWLPSGLFFVSIALFQLIWARLVVARVTTSVLAAGIMLNVGAIALWALSRTSGAPFGPHAGEPELVRAADLCALLLQIYVVMAAGWVVYRGHHGEPIPAFGNAIVLLGATAVVALASTVGVASGLQHGHPEQAGAATDHHGPAAGPSEAHHGVQADPLPAAPAPTEPALQSDEPLDDDHADHPHHE